MLSVLAAVEPDFASYVADVVKQVPWATPLLLWILDLRKQLQARDKKIESLETRIEKSNEKIQDDVIPLLTRLSDLIPTLLRKLK